MAAAQDLEILAAIEPDPELEELAEHARRLLADLA